jgi:hypothetical protein
LQRAHGSARQPGGYESGCRGDQERNQRSLADAVLDLLSLQARAVGHVMHTRLGLSSGVRHHRRHAGAGKPVQSVAKPLELVLRVIWHDTTSP